VCVCGCVHLSIFSAEVIVNDASEIQKFLPPSDGKDLSLLLQSVPVPMQMPQHQSHQSPLPQARLPAPPDFARVHHSFRRLLHLLLFETPRSQKQRRRRKYAYPLNMPSADAHCIHRAPATKHDTIINRRAEASQASQYIASVAIRCKCETNLKSRASQSFPPYLCE